MNMYRAVGNYCAVDFENFDLPISRKEAMVILDRKGFRVVDVNIISLARKRIGISKYRRNARLSEASSVFDCSTFTKWLYGQRGIWLPRRSIQQRELGDIVDLSNLKAGDLVFRLGFIDYFLNDPIDGVGHVGIATGEKTIIHAANGKKGIIEVPVHVFSEEKDFRGARRIIPENRSVFTFVLPPGREVETSDDIKWIILKSPELSHL